DQVRISITVYDVVPQPGDMASSAVVERPGLPHLGGGLVFADHVKHFIRKRSLKRFGAGDDAPGVAKSADAFKFSLEGGEILPVEPDFAQQVLRLIFGGRRGGFRGVRLGSHELNLLLLVIQKAFQFSKLVGHDFNSSSSFELRL
ncbi:unnamed protein product, partial [Aphanomyces euteiches]